MHKDMYDTFDDKHIKYSFPYAFREDTLDYLDSRQPTYEMNYEDTAIIPFQIGCEFIFYGIRINLYNFRGEEVYTNDSMPDEYGRVYLVIDETLSETLIRGLYKCQVQAISVDNNGGQKISTLIYPDDCTIYVK